MTEKVCVIFGGTGFIGSHLAIHLAQQELFDRIVLADIRQPREDFSFDSEKIVFSEIDVRKEIVIDDLPGSVELVVNLAAVHREPGHEPEEYYETNLLGAENVCAWAEKVGCSKIVFTSSIAPYGPTESVKTEESIPVPISPYGGSKLAAEKIHVAWQKSGASRSLVIVRPGVVFGPGERGNVTRLVQATLRRYFLYMGNKNTRKAGGYVKELVRTMVWALNRISATGGVFLYNFTMKNPPTVQDYVNTVCTVSNVKRFVPSVPYFALLSASYFFDFFSRIFGIKQPISPVRIKKLVRSNNIQPSVLVKEGYQYCFDLKTAMEDWHKDRPDEWK